MNCEICGKEIIIRKTYSKSRIKKLRFCSNSCKYKHKSLVGSSLVSCGVCGVEFKIVNYVKKLNKYGFFCSKKCYSDFQKTLIEERSGRWKGDNITVATIHWWLKERYGKPNICEGENCNHKSKIYDWCLKKGHEYKRDRNCFLRMCRSCHRKYDFTEEKREKLMKNLIWNR
jgi:hypothetical protein